MFQNHAHFDRRVRHLNRKHSAMARGTTTSLRKDGLIVVKPQRQRVQFPLKFVVVVLAALILFKGFLLTVLGPVTYDARVAKLAAGTSVEQAGAWVMQTEPVTEFVAEKIRSVYR